MLASGCQQWFLDDADREVAELIQARQRAALGVTADAGIARETGLIRRTEDMYSFVPSPSDPDVPNAFKQATQEVPPQPDAGSQSSSPVPSDTPQTAARSQPDTPSPPNTSAPSGGPTGSDAPTPGPQSPEPSTPPPASGAAGQAEGAPPPRRAVTLSDALAYSLRHARSYQSEKERLYLSALDLTLERYLWTPRFVDSVLSLDYENQGELSGFDQALTAVSNFAVEQRLPYGGEVTARVINTIVRDVRNNVSTSESGQIIVDARLPLLRGAGPVAYESRYQTERNFVYAVRAFERFRREFLVTVAGDFFDLLSVKAQIGSAEAQVVSLKSVYEREQALADAGRKLQIEADRARVSMLNAENAALMARERYDTALDRFKIQIGMPTHEAIDAVESPLTLTDPKVSLAEATETALRYRLDLLTRRDLVDDARRAVEVARNNLLPQVDLSGGVTFDTDPARFNASRFDARRSSWRAGLSFEVPLDRKRERNDLRSILIALRQAERDFEEFHDTVRLEVRRALRRLEQVRSTLDIQHEQIRINELRLAEANAKLKLGRIASNRDVVDAENDLRNARNSYAAALSDFRRAVLEFLRDTGTLRLDDNGMWTTHDAEHPETPAAAPPREVDAGP